MADEKKSTSGQRATGRDAELKLTPRGENFSEWYIEVVKRAKLADNSDVRGAMVIRPNGYALWENMHRALDKMFKDTGHRNAYFPVLIPEAYLAREKKHVADFAPQVAVVTQAGGKELPEGERYVIRPTSETIINRSFANWVQSHRDLPLLINQWCNVVRWEMRPRLFLRTTEFLWQEGHTCHATEADAQAETLRMLDVYATFAEEFMAMPVFKGEKTESERFPGAERTYSVEAMMQDKKALQAGTSHMLGQNFSKMFDTMFQTAEGKKEYVWQTSWGVSTRLIGALIMTHADDAGLVVPPRLAPTQVAIMVIGKTDAERTLARGRAQGLLDDLRKAGIAAVIDDDASKSAGFRFAEVELVGVCVRADIGPRDVEAGQTILVRRDTRAKTPVDFGSAVARVREMLDAMQSDMLARAKALRAANTFEVDSIADMRERADQGFLLAHWDGTAATEAKIKDEFGLTTRNRPFDVEQTPGKCVLTGRPSSGRILFAKAY